MLEAKLESFGIPVSSKWGRDAAKSLDNLAEEIDLGEAKLILLREIEVVRVRVQYQTKEGILHELREEGQVLHGGTGDRTRVRNTSFAIWEKLHFLKAESPEAGLLRALREELGITGAVDLQSEGESVFIEEPLDYPGLPTKIRAWDFLVKLRPEQFVAEGYTEITPRAKTKFSWVLAQTKPRVVTPE